MLDIVAVVIGLPVVRSLSFLTSEIIAVGFYYDLSDYELPFDVWRQYCPAG